ncbi:hypothetical protein DSM104299_00996 [Baekduia alba]|uniref:phage tail protein n=1 Tax=Baekduia alba TaxID=2997333 RepID=UPI002340A746|nr:phage tail protein [Baekduia alba]WCB92306.1 hypothetical protein DSM104299_00996 [Baekduia alba]
MPVPSMGAVAAEIYQQLRPLARDDEAYGWPLAHYVAAKYKPLEEVASWVRDSDDGPGYSVLLDIDRCPAVALPWLAQFKGVVIPAGLAEAEQRAWIRSAEGQHRGSVDALKRAGARHLTGTKSVRVLERVGGNAYNLTAVTRTSETPDPIATKADLMSAKRIGIVLTHVVTDEAIVDEATRTFNAITAAIDSMTLPNVT